MKLFLHVRQSTHQRILSPTAELIFCVQLRLHAPHLVCSCVPERLHPVCSCVPEAYTVDKTHMCTRSEWLSRELPKRVHEGQISTCTGRFLLAHFEN